mgnify:CR=1 FL=1
MFIAGGAVAMSVRILIGDARDRLKELPDESVNCVVTSPPYFGLRDYGMPGQIGLEPTPDEFVAEMVSLFREARRVLRPDGTLWLNLGDSYAGSWGAQSREHAGKHAPNISALSANQVKAAQIRISGTGSISRTPGLKPKDMIGIPWMVAFALSGHSRRHAGFNGRWDKMEREEQRGERAFRNTDLFFASIDAPYGAIGNDSEIIALDVATHSFKEAHFATFPPALIEPCIKAGCPTGGVVLDPFGGAGTTGLVADRLQRNAILIELNPEYAEMAARRIRTEAGVFADVQVDSSFPVPVSPVASSASPSTSAKDDNGMRE